MFIITIVITRLIIIIEGDPERPRSLPRQGDAQPWTHIYIYIYVNICIYMYIFMCNYIFDCPRSPEETLEARVCMAAPLPNLFTLQPLLFNSSTWQPLCLIPLQKRLQMRPALDCLRPPHLLTRFSRAPQPRRSSTRSRSARLRGNHLSNTTCLTQFSFDTWRIM